MFVMDGGGKREERQAAGGRRTGEMGRGGGQGQALLGPVSWGSFRGSFGASFFERFELAASKSRTSKMGAESTLRRLLPKVAKAKSSLKAESLRCKKPLLRAENPALNCRKLSP